MLLHFQKHSILMFDNFNFAYILTHVTHIVNCIFQLFSVLLSLSHMVQCLHQQVPRQEECTHLGADLMLCVTMAT